VQVPVVLDLLPPQLFDRQHPEPAPLVLRRREAHDAVAEVVQPHLAAALEDVQDVLLAPFDHVLLQDRDQSRGRDAVVLSQGIDGIEEDERPLREPPIYSVNWRANVVFPVPAGPLTMREWPPAALKNSTTSRGIRPAGGIVEPARH